jgi:hypothetical protein
MSNSLETLFIALAYFLRALAFAYGDQQLLCWIKTSRGLDKY